MRSIWKIIAVISLSTLVALIAFSGGANAQGPDTHNGEVFVGHPVSPGFSQPARELPIVQPAARSAVEVNPRQPGSYVPDGADLGSRPQIFPVNSTRTPTVTTSFDGISLATGGSGFPPDTVGDVGPNHYIQMVNSSFAIFDKSGNTLVGPSAINALWPGSDTTKCKTENDGDPIVLYDRAADRWMMTQFGVGNRTAPFYQCIAVSQTADPTGAWYTYSFELISSGTEFNDYGKFGIWPDGYYMGANEGGFTAYVFDRNTMLSGGNATFQRISSPNNMMLPSDLDGATLPPAGSPNYYYTMKGGNVIELWALQVDWNTPANTSFNKLLDLTSSGFIYDVCPADPVNKDSWECIPQPGTAQNLDAIGEWPMFRFQYRNQGTHESLVGSFTTDTAPGNTTDHAAPHWFELRRTGNGSWTLYNEGTISPDATHRWMSSAAMDKDGNIAVGYSASDNSSVFPSIRYATRLASDSPGTMGSEVTLQAGSAPQTGVERWGDYSAMSVDPADDCTFWYTNEYLTNSVNGWRTRIGSFKIPSCGNATTTAPNLTIAKTVVNDGGGSATFPLGGVVTYTIVLSNSGNGTASGVIMTDTLPSEMSFGGWVQQGSAMLPGTIALPGGGSVNLPANTIAWGPYDIQMQTEYRFVFTASIANGSFLAGKTIVNTAYFASTNAGSGSSSARFRIAGGSFVYLPLVMKN